MVKPNEICCNGNGHLVKIISFVITVHHQDDVSMYNTCPISKILQNDYPLKIKVAAKMKSVNKIKLK